MSKIIIGSSIGVFLGLWLFIASVVGIGILIYTLGAAKMEEQKKQLLEQFENTQKKEKTLESWETKKYK